LGHSATFHDHVDGRFAGLPPLRGKGCKREGKNERQTDRKNKGKAERKRSRKEKETNEGRRKERRKRRIK
jgi:hypothetical protein